MLEKMSGWVSESSLLSVWSYLPYATSFNGQTKSISVLKSPHVHNSKCLDFIEDVQY